ncbi:hypothetical protein [Megalodesulfovibrio gigas]|uniref:Uncharacterized protein n=1 Tax=Megalodesulfovibrio gigas (strain ATCC 19364 / DSM 1382 / NCIMB 9332 / VKM B-1759) TaxID=1121448 RepID=T2G7D5_MEGG1|nr:hypothetical protein [Megalodesulfovibrio gigas]AGW12089.1 hypothetical protein DGI_0152 [Megalodesulfovibrio gigas DSM 1382 = ATCC 19364]
MSLMDMQWRQCLDPYPEGDGQTYFPVRDEATVRVVIPGARIRRSGNVVRLGLLPIPRGLVNAASAYGYIVGRVVVGHQSEAVDAEPWDFDGNQVALTFGGDPCAVVRAGDAPVSDPVPFELVAGRDLVVSVILSGHGVSSQYWPCVGTIEDTGARLFMAAGRAACEATAPREVVEFFNDLGNAACIPFVATLETPADATLNMLPLATNAGPAVWDSIETPPADAVLRWRIPAAALALPPGGVSQVRLALQPGSEAWDVTAAQIGPAASSGWDFAGDSATVTFSGQAGVTVAPGALARSDAVPLNLLPSAAPDILVSLTVPAGAVLPRHARVLADGGTVLPWTYAMNGSPFMPGDGTPFALAGLEGSGTAETPPHPVYEVLGGNVGSIYYNNPMQLPAGAHVRILLPRQAVPGIVSTPPASATQARVVLFWHDMPWTSGIPDAAGNVRCWTLAGLRLGFAAHGPDLPLYQFEAAPVAIPFPGRGYPLAVDGPLVSDWFDLPRAWTPADRFLLSLELAQPLDVWQLAGGWQAVWSIWTGTAGSTLAPPAGGTPAPQWPNTTPLPFMRVGQQPFVRMVEVR